MPLFSLSHDVEDSFSIPDNSSIADNFKYNVVDMLSPVSKVYKAIKKDIPDHADFLLKEQLRVSKAKGDIDKAEKKYFEPIKKIIGSAKLTVDNVDEFLYARHAPEANARLRLTNAKHYLKELARAQKGNKLTEMIGALDARFDMAQLPTEELQSAYKDLLDIELKKANTDKEMKVKDDWKTFSEKPSGMTDAEAKKISKKWEKNTALKQIAKIFDRMNDEGLKISHKAGRLSDEEYQAVKGTFNYYAPLYREGHEKKRAFRGIGSGVKNLGSDVKTRGGSTKRAVHILANAIVNHEKNIMNAKKAEVARAFLKFVEINPSKDFWDFEEIKTKAAYDSSGNIKRVPAQNIENHEVRVKADGKTHIISANPNNDHAMRILDIIKGDQHNTGPIVGVLSRLNRALAMVNTTLNPEFIVGNFARDLQTAAINLSDTKASKMRKQIFKNVPAAMKGLHNQMRGDGSHEWAKIANLYESSGAKIGWIDYGRDIETKAKKLESQIDLFRDGHISKKSFKKLMSFVEDYNSIVENAVRLSTFKAGIDAGMSESKAAIMAKALTVNFNQKGAYGPTINSLYLFANAGIQGSTVILKTLKNSKQARNIVAGSALAAAGLAMANSVVGGDDDDGVPYYDKIDQYVKARNMIFMLPGTKGDFVRIPLPWGYNVFWAFGTELGDMMVQDDYQVLEGASRMISTAMDAFNPLQSATLLQTISPTIGDPFVQVGENKTFFGSPLMPEGNPFDRTPAPDSERYWRSVRPISKWIAKTANSLSGGNKIEPGLADVSPETLDLIFDTLTGGAGRFFLDTFSAPSKIASGDFEITDIPMVRRVAGTKSKYKTSTDYRENIAHVFRLREQAKEYPENIGEYQEDKAYQLYQQAKTVESKLRKLNKILKRTKDKKGQDKIKKRIKTIKQNFNRTFNIKRNAS